MRSIVLIFLVISLATLAGCRASREVNTTHQQYQSSNIDVEAHRLDSLWNLLTEHYKVHIEFFNPNEALAQPSNTKGSPKPTKVTQQGTAPSSTMTSDGLPPQGVLQGFGGMGAVKSIDIEAERTQSEQSLSQADSTAVSKTESEEARQTTKASETRQDNGTVAIVSVVAAVAILLFLIIIVRTYLKK